MDALITLLVSALGVGVAATYEFREGVRSLVRRARRRRDERELARFARGNAEEVAEGEIARIVGRVRSGPKTLTAPFSQRPCSYYEITVRRCVEVTGGEFSYASAGSAPSQEVETLGSFREGCDFFVDGHGVNVRIALDTEEGSRDDCARVHGITLATDRKSVV